MPTPSQQDRHELHLALERKLGADPAATLMELLPPVDWSEFARRSDIAELKAELKGDIAEVRVEIADVKGDLADVKVEIAELRADMKGQVTRFVVGSLPLAFATAALVLAAAKLT